MGDPRRLRNKYERPKMLWEKDRLEEEKVLKKTYGLKNMRELWMITQELKKVRREARKILSLKLEENSPEVQRIMMKLSKYGILDKESKIEDILSLSVRHFLERRLQTRVLKKGLAKTMAQSRQLITHGFIAVDGRKISSPSYLVSLEEDSKIAYYKPIDLEAPVPVVEKEKEEKSEQAEAPAATS